MIKVGLIGYGYWGPNLARCVRRCADTKLVRIADREARRLETIHREWPDVDLVTDAAQVSRAKDTDLVIIATPISTHYELALDALRNGKHVLVEKPMADKASHCKELIDEANMRNLLLIVDHTFLFTEAIGWVRKFVDSGQLGDLHYFDSIRANLGLFQRDASVLWDLAPHDLSILQDLVRPEVQSVVAIGACHAGSRVPDIVYVTLDLGGSTLAHFHVSWLSPVKVRRTLIAGSRRMIVYDDLEASEKIKVYDNGVNVEHYNIDGDYRMNVEYRIGDMMSPAVPNREALAAEVQHVADCINGRAQPLCTAESALNVVTILEAAEKSMNNGGARVPVSGMIPIKRPALQLPRASRS